jgi:hypothetical protein
MHPLCVTWSILCFGDLTVTHFDLLPRSDTVQAEALTAQLGTADKSDAFTPTPKAGKCMLRPGGNVFDLIVLQICDQLAIRSTEKWARNSAKRES